MVDGGHLKDTLAVGQLEVGHLHDDGNSLTEIIFYLILV